MKAIILAAGAGTRLRPLTIDRPKCLVEVAGLSILDRQLNVLRRLSVNEITIVSGYRASMVTRPGCRTIYNQAYASTNMVASLMCAQDALMDNDDVLVVYGDIVFEPRVLASVMKADGPLSVAVDMAWRAYWEARMDDPLLDAETLRTNAQGFITEIGDQPTGYDDIEGQYIGLFKIGASHGPEFVAAYNSLDETKKYRDRTVAEIYMTDFLQELIDQGWPARAVPIKNGWLEFDSVQDLYGVTDQSRDRSLSRFCDLTESVD